jgi:hypothetical protein
VVFGGATLASGFFNYLYHVVLAHVLGPKNYGNLATFLNVTSFMLIPASVVMLLYTRIGRRAPIQGRRESWGYGAEDLHCGALSVSLRGSLAEPSP